MAKAKAKAKAPSDPLTAVRGLMAGGAPDTIYFGVVFWGEPFLRRFMRYCALSLLSENNIPKLDNPRGANRFLFRTTDQDWDLLRDHPTFKLLCRHITPELLPMEPPGADDDKMAVMSSGHKAIAERMYQDRVYGSFVYPDTIYSDGSISQAVAFARAGKKVVVAACPRFANEDFLSELDARGLIKEGVPAKLPPRLLVEVAMQHMHSETLRHNWDAPYISDFLVAPWWRVPDGSGMVLHSFAWAPVLIDYSVLEAHDTRSLDELTIDCDYIYHNFPNVSDAHFVTDSDDFTLISSSSEEDLSFLPLKVMPNQTLPYVRERLKRIFLRKRIEVCIAQREFDPLKLEMFKVPVRIHSADVTGRWKRVEARAAAALENALGAGDRFDRRLERYLVWPIKTDLHRALVRSLLFQMILQPVRFLVLRPLRLLLRRPYYHFRRFFGRRRPLARFYRAKFARVMRHGSDLINQSGANSQLLRVVVGPVQEGKWYWEFRSPNLGVGGGSVADTATVGVVGPLHTVLGELGCQLDGWGWRGDGYRVRNGVHEEYGDGVTGDPTILMVALDADTGCLWFGRDGTWFDGGDPGSGRAPTFEGLSGTLYPAASSRHGMVGSASMTSYVLDGSFKYSQPKGFRGLVD